MWFANKHCHHAFGLLFIGFLMTLFYDASLGQDEFAEDISNTGNFIPGQIHLSLGESSGEMVVMWSTWLDTGTSEVIFRKEGDEKPWSTVTGTRTLFVDPGPKKHSQYIHRVTLTNLLPNTTYDYHCGSVLAWSAGYKFTTFPDGSDWSPRLALFGDLGLINAQSIPQLTKDVRQGMYDAVLHVGDFAYDMNDKDGTVGDDFMELMEPIAARLPYMTCVGNHEQAYNFTHYKQRFAMPGGQENMFYTFEMGPIKFIAISTEFYYFLNYGYKQVVFQYEWLERTLMEANQPENRAKQPWVIVFGHRPMYCSNSDRDDCTKHETIIRVGVPLLHFFGVEPLLYKYGVDLAIWAHEHSYERLWPVYNRKVYNGTDSANPYVNPGAPVHFTTGSAGCQEKTDSFGKKPEWSAFRSSDYGYTRLQAFNGTHLYFEQVSDD
ncbi:unnamed protein product, partial [Darwinula stevensoni]